MSCLVFAHECHQLKPTQQAQSARAERMQFLDCVHAAVELINQTLLYACYIMSIARHERCLAAAALESICRFRFVDSDVEPSDHGSTVQE